MKNRIMPVKALSSIFILFIFLLAGCSVRKSTLLHQESSSSEFSAQEVVTETRDTTIYFNGDSISTNVSLAQLNATKHYTYTTATGSINLTLKDSVITATVINNGDSINVKFNRTTVKHISGHRSDLKSDSDKTVKKEPSISIYMLGVAAIFLLILIYQLLKKIA